MLPSSRMSSANNVLAQEFSLRLSSGRRARRRDPVNHWKTSKRCFRWMSHWITDDPLTNIGNAAALSTIEATENTGTGPGSSRARPKDQSLRSLKFVTMCSRRVSQNLCVHQRTLLQRATELMQLLHRDCRNRQNSIYRRTLHIRKQPQRIVFFFFDTSKSA